MTWLNVLSLYSVFVPLLVGLIRSKHIATNSRVVLALVAFACVPHLATVLNEKELPVGFYNGYIAIDASAWPLVFFLSVPSGKLRRMLVAMGLGNLAVVLAYFAKGGFYHRFYYDLVCLNSAFQVIYIALYFYEVSRQDVYVDLKRLPLFWYSLGLLFYATCTFFVFLFYFEVNKYAQTSGINYLWRIHDFFNVLMYGLFTVGFGMKREKDASGSA